MSILNILFNTVFVLSQLIITNACTYCSCSVGKYAELGSGPAYYSDCLDIYTANTASQNGAYSINPNGQGAFQVYCDFTHTGGPWNVFQKRSQKNGAVNFGSQGWVAYENGFGTVSSDHWLGFTKLRRILALGSGQLRIDMTTTGNTETYAHYTGFNIGDAASKYTLTWSGFSGSVWNALSHHQNRRFTTHDQDNDYWWPANCGNSYWGQNNWWYGQCWNSNMNGDGTYGMYFAGHNRKTQLAVRIVRAATVPSYDCTVCPVGQYQGVSDFGGTTCTDCAKGQHQNNEGGGSCKNCIAGRVQPATGQSTCAACDAGKKQVDTGQQTCSACNSGRYQPNSGASSCTACEPGKYQTSSLQVSCDNCGNGQYSDQSAATICKNCFKGKFSSGGVSSCSVCDKGQYQDGLAAVDCKNCNKGQYTDNTGQISCKNCGIGHYQSLTGQVSCTSTCLCGYYCPVGSINSKAEVCGEGFYCPAGTVQRNPITSFRGTPVGTNPARFCGKDNCPTGSACANGVAAALLSWNTPAACKAGTPDAPYLPPPIDEDAIIPTFGSNFKVYTHPNVDNPDYKVVFTITRWPGSAPTDCGTSRNKIGITPKPSNNWLKITTTNPTDSAVSTPTGKPSTDYGTMGTTAGLDAEACSKDYAAEISATLIRKADNVNIGSVRCYTNIVISNTNEQPIIKASSLTQFNINTQTVPEDALPGFGIGTKLEASDVEVSAGLQQLTWKIRKCDPLTFSRAGAGTYQTGVMKPIGSTNCHIKISSCDGQIAVASGVQLNYETYTKYRLEVQATDDGSPALASAIHIIYIGVVPKNDDPTIVNYQTFYIQENVNSGTFVNMKSSSAPCNSNPDNTDSCEIMASDVDSNSDGFKFKQAATLDPFVITESATRHATGTDAVGNDAFNMFTTVKFVSSSVVLDYESGNTIFDLSVYAQDGDDATSNVVAVTIMVVDANDRPTFELDNFPNICDGKLCIHMNENNNEGTGSDREVDLFTYVEDPDAPADWQCCASSNPFELFEATSSDKPCVLSNNYQKTTNGFKGLAEKLNFENNDSCDLIVKITDKGAAVSENQLIHVKIMDLNDPPQGVAMTGICEVEENTVLGQSLLVDSTNFCQLTATDEDDTIFGFLKSEPSATTGVMGSYFSDIVGDTDADKWSTLNYFNVETNGRFTVSEVPDYEIAKSLTFDVFARDGRGKMSSKETITIKIKDVNEPPIIDASMQPEDLPPKTGRVGGDNKLCTAKFTIKEFKKNGDTLVSGQAITALYKSTSDNTNPQLNFKATDPDQGAVISGWNTVTYSLTSGYYDSDVFEIDSTSGAIKPIDSQKGSIDYESLYQRAGVIDGVMRINVVASDAGGGDAAIKATDCDIYITVIDLNEPPTIDSIPLKFGESVAVPFVFDATPETGVSVGDEIGPTIPAVDPDTFDGDIASCREATLEDTGELSTDDRALFGVTAGCQIYVKQITAGGKNLRSGNAGDGEFYKIYIEAYDQDDVTSAKRMYHINGKAGKVAPVFDTDDIMFTQAENIVGTVEGQVSTTTNNYSHWMIDTPQKLFVACTDKNVYQRGSPSLLGEPAAGDCDGHTDQTTCESPTTATGCEWAQDFQLCSIRQQSLRYQVVPSSQYPEIPSSNFLKIDKLTAELSFDSNYESNYEKLLIPDSNIHCDLGPPVRSGDGTIENPFQWVGRYPNGVGICRMFENQQMKDSGKKSKMGYLDAAALCAKGSARLPTLQELETAAAVTSAVTAAGDTTSTGANGEPSASVKGGMQSTGSFPLRPMNILDLWNWEMNTEGICQNGQTGDVLPCLDKTGIDQPLKVWTYNSKQAQLSSGGTVSNDDVWVDATSASTVTEVSGVVNKQDQLAVLCYVGDEYVNHKWIGNSNTADAYTQKIRKPLRGYSTLISCMDTSEMTIDESRFEYSPQSEQDKKYIFVEVQDVPEDPSFEEASIDIYIDENSVIGNLAYELVGKDEDPGDAMQLTFSLAAVSPTTLAFQLGTPETIFPYQSVRTIPLNIENALNFEEQSIFRMSVTITDPSERTAIQSITIHINDINEPPVLRQLGNPSEDSLALPAIYKRFQMKEDAPFNFEIGELLAWDPDAASVLIFSVTGTDNNGDIFGIQRTNRTSTGAGSTGSMTVAVLELRDTVPIDYEGKQLYTLDLTVSDGKIQDQSKVEIEIINVNDVTVENIKVVSTGETIMQTKGNEQLHITGTNFGIKYGADNTLKPDIRVTYGRVNNGIRDSVRFEATNCAVANTGTENSLIVCNSAAGYGDKLVWNVEVIRQNLVEGDVDSSFTTTYATPDITSIVIAETSNTPNALDTRGGTKLLLTGTNFGIAGLTLEGYYTATANNGWYTANNCQVITDTTVTCESVPGVGQDMIWKLEKVDHQWFGKESLYSIASTTSYAVPSIQNISNCESCSTANQKEFTTYGNQDVYITGDQFGPMADVNNKNDRTKAAGLEITIAYQNTIGFSYVQSIPCEVIIAHTQIKCKTVAGVSKDFVWTVNVAGQTSSPSSSVTGDTTYYSQPIITSLRGPGAYAANTKGGQQFELIGDFFGPKMNCHGMNDQSNNCLDYVEFQTTDTVDDPVLKEIFKGVNCIVSSQILLICKSPPGVGKNFAYKVSIGSQSSEVNADLFDSSSQTTPSYGPPVLSVLSRSNGDDMIDADTRGYTVDATKVLIYNESVVPETILITGSNFGPINTGSCFKTGQPCMSNSDCFNATKEYGITFDDNLNSCIGAGSAVLWNPVTAIYKAQAKGTNGGEIDTDIFTAIRCHVVVAHTQIKCDFAAGAGKAHEWILTIGMQDSSTPTSRYHPPEILSITGAGAVNGKTNGNQKIVLNGLNFGMYPDGATVSYGVTGSEYSPENCIVVSHEKITCTTVPGIGRGLFWKVTVRDQSNDLNDVATSSYAAPTINHMSPVTSFADGSDIRDFLVLLNVSNSGLADPLSNIVIQFDPACQAKVEDSCGSYEIPIEPENSDGTRQVGEFDILAFRVPMLKNQKNAKDISVFVVVYPSDRGSARAVRSAAVKSVDTTVFFSYNVPVIEQIVVTEHPFIRNMRKLTIIGRDLGSIQIGDFPKSEFAMRVNSIPLPIFCSSGVVNAAKNGCDVSCSSGDVNTAGNGCVNVDAKFEIAGTFTPNGISNGISKPITMQLGVDISNPNRTSTYVQKWERGAQNERHDEIIIIWSAPLEGIVSITRGGVTSNEVEFKNVSPKLLDAKLKKIKTNGGVEPLQMVPTLGSNKVNVNANDEIQMEIICRDCGSSKQMCCSNHTRIECNFECLGSGKGVPKLLEILIGSSELPDKELQKCRIVAGASTYVADKKEWTYRCQIPPYQGSSVDTRIRFDGRWSNATYTRYEAPTIQSLSSSVGGTKGSVNDFSGEQIIASVQDNPPVLLVHTNGESIKITGNNFGKPYAGDVTKFNEDYVIYKDENNKIQKWRPTIEPLPAHGGLSVNIPSGTSATLRSIDVQVGQLPVDIQTTKGSSTQYPPDMTTMYVAYRKPTLVAELVPLWRYNEKNRAGGFDVTIYGFDFMTTEQASTTHSLTDTQVWFRAELNATSGKVQGTPCVIVSTSYSKIVCKVGTLTPTKTASIDDDIAIAVTVDGQTSMKYMSQNEVTTAKSAVTSGSYTNDDNLIKSLSNDRDLAFETQLNDCMERSGGLTTSRYAYFIDLASLAEKVTTEQDIAFHTANNLLTTRQIEIQQCVSIVVNAFNKACSGIQTIESIAILEAAYKKDENKGLATTRTDNVCVMTGTSPVVEDSNGPEGGSSISGGNNGGGSIAAPETTSPSTPAVNSIRCATDIRNLPTQGGEYLYVKVQGLTIEYNFRAYLIDDTGRFPPIPVRGGHSGKFIIQPMDYQSGRIFGNLTLMVPPGQGKERRLILESYALFGGTSLKSDRGQTIEDTIGYGRPSINTTRTQLPIRTSTDSCLGTPYYESELTWAARTASLRSGFVDGVQLSLDEVNALDKKMYERRCLKYDTIELFGSNFGEETAQLNIWVEGMQITDEADVSKTIKFWVYNGTAFTKKFDVYSDISNRGFAGESSGFSFVHTHNRLVLRGPRGYGPKCMLHVQVAGQTTIVPIDFSFKAPTADYSEPRAYDAKGEDIVIHGQNFGGIESTATVFINGEPCDNAVWNRQHDIVGLPYVSCKARETVAGIANISLFVAGQQSSFVITETVDSAGVRTVCQESKNEDDRNLETGKQLEFWGRNEPVGELCTPCPDGSLCKTDTYDIPTSLVGYYIVELDISNKIETKAEDENAVTKRERREYERGLETFKFNGLRVCPEERLFDPKEDAERVAKFPFAESTKRELCHVAMPCKPLQACKGRNECAEGYQYNELQCNISKARRDGDSNAEIIQACNHTLQCQTRSAGKSCATAITSVCRCPSDWELGNRACLKECILDESKLSDLKTAGCTLDVLEKSLAGRKCDYFNPEDCAVCLSEKVCVTSEGVNTGVGCSNRDDCIASAGFTGKCEKRGTCKCAPTPRCIVCTAGTHYRSDGKCEACPENMALVFAMFFLGIFFVILVAYVLDQKKMNLAFLIIPVDYFQVLALLSRADIRWPKILLTILRALQFFNFNLDIATPECLLAGVFTYEMKYYATLLVAPTIIVCLVLAYVWHQFFYRCCLKRKPDKLYASKLVGTFMLLIYCVYLSCTTRALEVFNCSPTDPDDGWEYVGFTDESCDGGGLCRCWDSEHLPHKLLFPSLLSLGIYTLGFPLFLFWLLRCGNRKSLLKEDQILRANGIGETLATNPRAYHMRVRYHKMYYYYKPGKSYWMLVILARKVGIAFCALIFRTNPGFMLASIVLILFIAFSMQTKHSPYMSASQQQIVLAEHAIKAESGDRMHTHIAESVNKIKKSQTQHEKGSRRMKYNKSLSKLGNDMDSKEKAREKAKKQIQYFFDYNTVELTLLFCAVLVCLAGVMFESDRFKETNGSGTLRYAWQRDMVTYLVIIIVMLSFVYLAVVMANEMTGYTPECIRKCCASKKNAMMSAADTIQNQKDDNIEMSVLNPSLMHERSQQNKQQNIENEEQRQIMEEQKNQLQKQQLQLNGMKQKAAQKSSGRGKKKRGGKNKNKKKKVGNQTKGSFDEVSLDPNEVVDIKNYQLQNKQIAAVAAKHFQNKKVVSDEVSLDPKKMDAVKNYTKVGKRKIRKQSFIRHESADGKEYFSNAETTETTWNLPKGAILLPSVQESGSSQTSNPVAAGKAGEGQTTDWNSVKDEASGKTYYHNTKNNSVTWTKPTDF